MGVSISYGQIPDSTLYRTNKIKEIRSRVHMVGFTHETDTCLFSIKKINEYGQPTYVLTDYNCQGWNVKNELRYQYNENNHLIGMETLQNDVLMNKVEMEVDSFGRVTRERNTIYDPFMVVEITNEYYGNDKLADSMKTTNIAKEDTTHTLTRYTYINNKLKSSETIDIDKSRPVNSLKNKYDEKGRLVREEFIYFLGYDNDNITKLQYNDKDQVIRTQSELDKIAAQFYYDKTGLLKLTHYFNKFESLEREMWHEYTFYE